MQSLNSNKGFSLVELSVVLLIVGIVFIGAVEGLSSFRHNAYSKETKTNLENAKAQIIQFAVINKYLPCPDTDADGLENRSSVGGFEACSSAFGGLPFLDLGLNETEAFDAWGNKIRYAVNSNSTSASVCDKTTGGSYFCNESARLAAWFTYDDTPPLQGNSGSGNYRVCNENTSSCTSSTTDLITNSAVVILAAYNEDGAATLADCSSETGANAENCDTDLFYHQASPNPFDDQIAFLSGYEIKAKVLSNVISWNSFDSAPAQGVPEANYDGYDFTETDKTGYMQENDTVNNDVIMVNRNFSAQMDLGAGDDYVMIGNDLQSETIWDGRLVDGRTEGEYYDDGSTVHDGSHADLFAGAGDDQIYIANDAYSRVDLGVGDDKFIIGGNLLEGLVAGEGHDKAWLQGTYPDGTAAQTSSSASQTGPTNAPQSEWDQYGSESEAKSVRNAYNNENENLPGSIEVPNNNGNLQWWRLTDTSQTVSGNDTTTENTYTRLGYKEKNGNHYTRERYVVNTVISTTIPADSMVDLGAGDDVLWLGSRIDNPDYDAGTDPIEDKFIETGGGVSGQVDGGEGNDTLVLETVDSWSDLSTQEQSSINNFELIIFADDGEGNRNQCAWVDCGS